MMAFKLVFTGLVYIYHYRRALFKALWLPILCSFAVNIFANLSDDNFFIFWLNMVLSTFIYTICAISIHRILILGPEQVPAWRQQGWTMRETIFTAVMVAIPLSIWLILIGPLEISKAVASTGSTLILFSIIGAVAATYFMMMRLLLLLPMIAIDREPDIAKAWRLGGQYPFAIPFSIMLASAIASLPGILISLLPGGAYAAIAINEIIFVVDVAVLSAAMRLVMGEQQS